MGVNKLLYRLFKSTSDMATPRKKAVLTIKEKYLALKELEKEGTSKKSIAENYFWRRKVLYTRDDSKLGRNTPTNHFVSL